MANTAQKPDNARRALELWGIAQRGMPPALSFPHARLVNVLRVRDEGPDYPGLTAIIAEAARVFTAAKLSHGSRVPSVG